MKLLYTLIGLTLSLAQFSAFTAYPYLLFGPIINTLSLFFAIFLFANATISSSNTLIKRKELNDLLLISTIFFFFSLLALFNGHSSINYLIKILFPFIPYLLLSSVSNKIARFKWQIKYSRNLFLIGLLSYLFFTFVICEYNPYLGKFYSRPEFINLIKTSSNGISEIFMISCFPFSLIWILRKKYNKFYYFLLFSLPLIHWSKSHIVIYILSVFFAYFFKLGFKNILLSLLLLLLLYFSVEWILELIQHGGASHSFEKLSQLRNFNLTSISSIPKILTVIGTIGDETRAGIYLAQYEWLHENPFFGYGDNASKDLLHGYDFHSILGYYWVQFGLIPLLAIYVLLFRLVRKIKTQRNKKIAKMTLIYFILKGLFSTPSPVFILLTLSIIIIIDRTEARYNENNRFS